MRTAAVVAGAAALAAVVGVVVWRRGKPVVQPAAPAAAAAVLPTGDKGAAGAGAKVVLPAAPVAVGKPAAPSPVADVAGKVASQVLDKALGAAAGTVKAGLQVAELQRQVVTAVAGPGLGNAAAVFGPAVTAYAGVKTGVQAVAAKVGVPAPAARNIAQTVALGVVLGPPAAIAKGTAELASLGIRAVAGPKVEADVRRAFSSLDPTNSKNITHAPIAAAAKGVQAAANFLGGGISSLFGRK